MSAPGDRAVVTVAVAVDPDAAFEVFTREIDLWWRRGPAYRQIVRASTPSPAPPPSRTPPRRSGEPR